MKEPKDTDPFFPSELAAADVTIVGLGLMGGSLAGALRGKCRSVSGVARRPETLQAAFEMGLIDQGTTDLSNGVRHAHAVVLAAPVRAILSLLDEIGPLLPPGCLVMDLGSTKAQIIHKMNKLPPHVQPLGGHPMCGKEISGIQAAESTLYQDRTFILSPLPRTSDAALALGCTLAEAVGARPLVLEPLRHDRLAAAVSHLPYLLACALTGTAADMAVTDPVVWDVAAGGYRDSSRLAASDVTVMLDILLTNREAVLDVLATCQERLRGMARLIESCEERKLRAFLAAIHDHRTSL